MNSASHFAHWVCVIMLALSSVAFAGAAEPAPSSSARAKDGGLLIYIGTYTNAKSKGIYACRMDPSTGALSPLGLAAMTPNPTFLALDPARKFLFAANEITHYDDKAAGSVTSYSIDKDTARLTKLSEQTSVGAGPCHVTVDRTGRNVLVANYGSGSVAVLPLSTDGRLGHETAFVQDEGKSINHSRQEGPHAHCMTLDENNHFAYACDLGTDKIMIYKFDAAGGALTPNEPAFVSTKPGAGPRHITFSPDRRHAYVINELNSTVSAYAFNSRNGALKQLQTISALPEDFNGENTAAEVEVSHSGKFLYGSNRGHNSIAVFSINPAKGTLTKVQDCPTLGKTPRHFAIDPTGRYLLVANQDSNDVVVFAIDSMNGQLTSTGQKLEVPAPVCVLFVDKENQ